MKYSQSDIQKLLEKYTSNTLSQSEWKDLAALIQANEIDFEAITNEQWKLENATVLSENNNKTYQRFRDEMRMLTDLQSNQQRRLKRRKVLTLGFVAVLLCVSAWMITSQFSKQSDTNKKTYTADLQPAKNAATITLYNGKHILFDGNETNHTQEISLTNDSFLVLKTLSVPSINTTLFSLPENQIATQVGNICKILLPDSTKVWLNASSKIRFAYNFNSKSSSREVTLEGEGYFEVKRDPKHPFIVHTLHQNVEDLGTHFDINAYHPDEGIVTTLLEGKVKISDAKNTTPDIYLLPGQQYTLNKNSKHPIAVDTSFSVAWKNGLFSFKNTPIQNVLEELGRWYDAKISYQGKIPDKKITGDIYRNTKASQVLELLRYEGVNCKISDRQIVVLN